MPKGRLAQASIQRDAWAGWRLTPHAGNCCRNIDDSNIRCVLIRARAMAHYVDCGTLNHGLDSLD